VAEDRIASAALQGALWSRAASDWAELQEPLTAPLWEALLDATMVGAGTRLLDAGCGAGGASLLAARRGAQVNGLDAAEALLAIARQRVPDGDFRLGDVAELPYGDGSFDTLLAVDVLPYTASPVTAVRELRRTIAPDGITALAVWGAVGECEQQAMLAAVGDVLPAPLQLAPSALAQPGVLENLAAQAGLRVCASGTVDCPADYPDEETAWLAQSSTGPLQAALRVVGERRLMAAVLRAFRPYTTSSGGIYLQRRAHYILAAPKHSGSGGLVERRAPMTRLT
jgi:SAM-dependent methyltransferase